jgi:mycothiol synthase
MLKIRAFAATDAEYEQIHAIRLAALPQHPMTLESFKHYDATRNPKHPYHRDVIEKDGQLIGFGVYGQSGWSYHPDKYFWNAYVAPNHDEEEAYAVYFEHVLKTLAKHDLLGITIQSTELLPIMLQFLKDNGFVEVMRYLISELDLATFDENMFAGVVEKVEQSGIKIVTVAQLEKEGYDWKRKLYDLEMEIAKDIPSPGDLEPMTFEIFEKQALGSPGFMAEGWFIAMDGDELVGDTALWSNGSTPNKLDTGVTGVLRSHRRRGIAMAVKLRSFEFARQYGAKVIETENEENNPMYQINLKLGFKLVPAWLDLEKQLRDEITTE